MNHERWSGCKSRLPLIAVVLCAFVSMGESCSGPYLYEWTPATRQFHSTFYAVPVRLAASSDGIVIDDSGALHRVGLDTGAQGWAYLPVSPASRLDPASLPWRRSPLGAVVEHASDAPGGKRWRRAFASVSTGEYRVVLFPLRTIKGLIPPGILDGEAMNSAPQSPMLEPWTSVFLKGRAFEIFPAEGGETDALAAVNARKVAFFVAPNVLDATLWPFDMDALSKTHAATGAREALGYALETISENTVKAETGAFRIGGVFFHHFTAPPLRNRIEAIVGSPEEERFWRDADKITRRIQNEIFALGVGDTFSILFDKSTEEPLVRRGAGGFWKSQKNDTTVEIEVTFPTSRGGGLPRGRIVTFVMTRPMNEGWRIADFRSRERQ